MDRRQRKTREAIFNSFTDLLSRKDFNRITVAEIIEGADVGRATFYSHFETKDYLLKELCKELFCHIFDSEEKDKNKHKHIFECEGADSVFLHLLFHLMKNDKNILSLLSSRNNELFLRYFRADLEKLVESHLYLFESKKKENLPTAFYKNHIASTFVETIRWWIENGMKEAPETINGYFFYLI